MKTQKFNCKSLLLMSCMALLFFGFYTPQALGSMRTDGNGKALFYNNSTLFQGNSGDPELVTGSLQTLGFKSSSDLAYDFVVPQTATNQYLYIHAEGADGGKRQVKEIDGSTRFTVNGGSGATIEGVFEIGTGANQIPPGSAVRIIIGQKGETRIGQGLIGCTGGGGTGVLFKRPNEAEWRLLIVAGGGGGAYSDCCLVKGPGRSAEITENGGDGGKNDGSGGSGGNNGFFDYLAENTSTSAYSGHGILCEHCWQGEDHDNTRLPTGESDVQNGYTGNQKGGSGFCLGGMGDSGGGGGGGYSGGGYGKLGWEGGGGGSYLNSDMAKYSNKIRNGNTSDTQDGFVRYEFLNSAQLFRQIKFAYNTGKCIDDYASHTDNGTNIQTYSCHSNNNQKWFFHPIDRTIHSMLNSGKCLDLSNSNTSNGTNIQLWDCNGTDAQHWVYNGLFKTIHSSVNSDKCFDAANGSASTSNVNLQLWDCQYSNNNQKWNVDGATTVSNPANVKHIVPVIATGFAVHSHTGAESGSNIQLWTKDNTNTAEQWYFDGLAIKMRDHQNLCIDLSQSNTSNGNNIQLYNCNGSNAQKWIYDGMTRSIRSVVNPGKCMQIEYNTDGVYGKRSNVQIYDCNGSAAQQFTIQE